MELLSRVQMEVLGVDAGPADAGDTSHALALSRMTADGTVRAHLMVNAYWEPLTFTLPPADAAHGWRRWIDTSLPSPEDIYTWANAPAVPGSEYQVGPRSVAALIALTEAPVP
jgi:glycogen operon protein